jgi:hypothetical protein
LIVRPCAIFAMLGELAWNSATVCGVRSLAPMARELFDTEEGADVWDGARTAFADLAIANREAAEIFGARPLQDPDLLETSERIPIPIPIPIQVGASLALDGVALCEPASPAAAPAPSDLASA